MRRQLCLWGLLAMPLALLACGGKSTEQRQDAAPSLPEPTRPDPIAKGGSSSGSAGGATQQPPLPEPSTGGADNTASGGADSTDPCADVEPSCAPGEPVCDPLLGVTASCDECGVPRPNQDAGPCVRLIASDKESNYVCAVRGATDLQCLQPWGKVTTISISADTREIVLRDDVSSSPTGQVDPCLRSQLGVYSCLGSASNCSHVAVGDYGTCAICDGRLSCNGNVTAPAVLPEPLLDLAITDGSLFALGEAGLAVFDLPARLPDFWKGTPRDLRVDHQQAGCMFSTLDEMACWIDPRLPWLRSAWTGFRKWVPTTMPQACALDAQGRAGCGNVLEDAAPTLFEAENVVDLVASGSLVCVLTRVGRVLCWNQGEPLELPAGW